VFFIHDMLPFETPEYFPAKEFARHVNRMRNLARYGAGAVVSSEVVKSALLAHLRILGRGDMPVQVAPIPVAPVFREPSLPDHALSFHPFFIQCGTIEPRKNHLMILQVWRELVARRGSAAPKLLLAGARGWENENIVDLLDRSQALRDHVWEVSGLPTPVLKRLMGSARALLMPSFAEGFGLPVVEALAAGVPIVASDIPVFHEIAEGAFTPVGPIDGEGWRREIERLADRPRAAGAGPGPDRRERFFSTIEGFIGSL
jgi:glycosyltransferase involved in cell wall biosynthesis